MTLLSCVYHSGMLWHSVHVRRIENWWQLRRGARNNGLSVRGRSLYTCKLSQKLENRYYLCISWTPKFVNWFLIYQGIMYYKTLYWYHKHTDYILITNLMHWLLFIHKILFSSKCFEPAVVHVQHMVLSLSMRVLGGLSVHSLSENWP